MLGHGHSSACGALAGDQGKAGGAPSPYPPPPHGLQTACCRVSSPCASSCHGLLHWHPRAGSHLRPPDPSCQLRAHLHVHAAGRSNANPS